MTAEAAGGMGGYRAFLGPAGRRTLFTAGIVARVPLALVSYSILFFVQATTGSFATAGLASGLATAAMALVGPVFGRIADRRGQSGALVAAAIAHPLSVVLLIVCGTLSAPLPVVAVASVLVGASIAPVGAFMRARWSLRLGEDPLLQVAFSLESIADELVWVFGPALAALVAAAVNPAAGLVLSALFGLLGSVWLLRGAPTQALPREAGVAPHRFRPWTSRPLIGVLVANIAVGLVFGINDVTVVSWTTSVGVPEIAGLVLTAYSIGSVTGGFLMGLVPGRWPAYRIFVGSTLLFGIFWGILSLAGTPFWLFPLGLFAGATITPFTISGNRVVHDSVAPEVFTEALAWVTACVVGAMALGNFVGGIVAESWTPDAGFTLVGYLAGVPFVIVALLGLGRRRRRSAAEPAGPPPAS